MKMSLQNIFVMITLLAMLCSVFAFSVASPVFAQSFNQQINYQGKLATPAGVAVSDGTYSMVFRLYSVASGGSNIWSETQTVTVTDGLFSVMLGTSTSLASVDFSQTLYLGININADGEMTPRKILGAVPAAFEAGNAQTLDNIATSSFLRSDEADTLAASSASTLLTLQQNGAGDLLSLTDGTNSLFQVNNAGQVSIGTTTDLLRRLTVAGADNAGSRFIDTTNNVIVDVRAEDFQGFIGTISSSDLRFVTDNTSRMTLTTGGALGIGTTTPTQRLTVSGGDALFEQNIRLAGALYDASGAAGTSGMVLQTSGTSTQWVATSTLGIGSSVFTDGGDYTYLTSQTDGLVIGSTTAPVGSANVALSVNQGKIDTTPNLVEMSETTILNAGGVYAAFGDYVLLRQSVNARIYDVSDVTAPVQVSTLPRGVTSLNAAVVVGDYVYTAVENTDIGKGPRIYDISNVSNPVLISPEATSYNRDYEDIAVSGGYAYLIRGAGAGGDMDVYDVSDPSAPREISTVSLDDPGQRIVVQGNYAYIGDDDLVVYDISDPFNPSLVDTASLSGGAVDIAIRGRYLYALNGNSFEGLVTYDISDPTNMTQVDSIDTDGGTAIVAAGDYLFMTGGSSGVEALRVFSVRDADNPVLVDTIPFGNTLQAGRIQLQGNYLHVVDQVQSNNDEYRIYDIGGLRTTTGEIGDLLADSIRTGLFNANSVAVTTGLNIGKNALIGGALTVTGSASSTLLSGNTNPSFIVESGYVGIGTTTPTQKLSVSGNLRLTGALYDSSNSAGTNGMVLQTTATGTQWVATSSLGFGSAVTFGTDNQVPVMNAAGDDFEYSSGFTYNGTNLNLAAGNGIAFGGTRYLHADATNDSIAFGEYAGATFGVGTTHNVALGFEAGRYASTSDADENNYIGRQAGYNNTGGTNNLFGAYAGYDNTGFFNNMLGQNAGAENTGAYNILIGGLAGYGNIGGNNVFVGELAGRDNEGDDGVFLGTSAGQNNTGSFSNMFGSYSGQNSTGSDNNLIGRFAGQNSTGSYNNILGTSAGQDGTGSYNNILGNAAGRNNTGSYSEFLGFETAGRMSASYTVAIGGQALRGGLGETYDGNAATTTNNTVIGYGAGRSALTGADNNILLGYQAANSLTTGANNIIIGYDVEAPSNSGSNQLNIGNLIFGTGIDGINTTLSSGNIGIGTTTPTSKLSVAGDAQFTGLITAEGTGTSTFSDNVHVQGDLRVGNSSLLLNNDSLTATGDLSLVANSTLDLISLGDQIVFSQPGPGAGITETNDTSVTLVGAQSGTQSFSHTVPPADEDRLLVVIVSHAGDSDGVSGVTYDGISMTNIPNATLASGGDTYNSAWYLVNPPVGSNTVAVTYSGSPTATFQRTAISFAGVNQSSPIGYANSVADATPSMTIVNDAEDYIVDFLTARNDQSRTPNAGQTTVLSYSDNLFISYRTGVANATVGWSGGSTDLIHSAFVIQPATGSVTERARFAASGNFGIGTSTPSQKLTVSGNLRLTGALYDSSNSAGTAGMVLQSTAAGTQWVATSSLGISSGSSVTFGTDNQVPVMNAAGDDFEYSSGFTYNGTNLNLAAGNGIAFGGTRMFYTDAANDNVAAGEGVLGALTSGTDNTGVGDMALGVLTIGNFNTAMGSLALEDVTEGSSNAAFGRLALANVTTASGNTGIGSGALRIYSGTQGLNTALGENAAYGLQDGGGNVMIGQEAMYRSTTSSNSVVIGQQAGYGQTSQSNYSGVVILGQQAGYGLTSGSQNVFLGRASGYDVTSGSNNIFLGYQAANSLTTGSNNIVIGHDVEAPSNTGSNQLNIGNLIFGTGIDGTGYNLSSGSVGIGVKNPTGFETGTGSRYLEIAGSNGSTEINIQTAGASTGHAGALSFSNDTYRTGFVRSVKTGPSTLDGVLEFGTSDGIANATTKMTIDTAGNVGIGTTTPTSKLSVAQAAADVGFTVYGAGAQAGDFGALSIDAAGQFVLQAGGTGRGVFKGAAGAPVAGWSDSDFVIGDDKELALGEGLDYSIGYNSADDSMRIVNGSNLGSDVNTFMTFTNTGGIGMGTTTPEARLSIQNTGVSGAGVVGIDQYLGTANSVAAAVQYGNRSYFNAVNTATTTIVGNMYRLADNTAFGNTVRGLEVQTNRGSNTQGENTALSGFARTFGVRGVTSGDAGGSFEPAGGFFETEGTTQGNAIRGYSDSITSATLLSLFQDTSAFTGTGLEMNFGNTTGSFSSSSSKYLDFQNGGTSVFTVSAYGTTTIGDGTTNNMAGLQIGFGGICVDNDGSCTASTTGRISAVSYETGNSDLAENYFSSQSLQTGEIVTMSGGLSVVRAEKDAALPVLGVVSTKPGLTMGYDDSSLRAGETAYPIALTGRVPVQLSTENGPIKKGDQLMLSSLPGVAMKATGTGATIGIALEDFTESRMYSDTYLNQFGDDMVDPIYEPVVSNTDTRINDGCYYGGGNATGEEACVPLSATTSAGQINEVNDRLAQESVAEQIEALKGVRSQTKRVDGKSVKVGQVVMFVQNGHRWVDEDQLAKMNTLFATSSVTQLGEDESETLFDRLVALADNFIDGVLSIAGLKADKVETSELCIDGVCVDSSQLRALLEASNNNDQTVEVIPVPTEDEEESAPDPEEDEEETQSPEPPAEENTDATSTEPVATSTPETSTSTPSTDELDAEPEESTPPEPPAEDEPIPESSVEEEPLADEDSEPEPEPSVEAEPDPEPEESTPPESNESPL